MNTALIRLEKKIVIDAAAVSSDTTHEELKKLWNYCKTEIEYFHQRFGRRYNWTEIREQVKKELVHTIDEYGQATARFLAYRLPQIAGLFEIESSLVIEGSRTEIAGFTTEASSLVLHYFLRTEPLTLIDTIGDRLLLSKGNMQKNMIDGVEIANTFMLALNNDYSISNYARLKI